MREPRAISIRMAPRASMAELRRALEDLADAPDRAELTIHCRRDDVQLLVRWWPRGGGRTRHRCSELVLPGQLRLPGNFHR